MKEDALRIINGQEWGRGVVGLVLDGCSTNVKLMHDLENEHALLGAVCGCHELSTVLRHIGKIGVIARAVDKATLVTTVFSAHDFARGALGDQSGKRLVRLPGTRFAQASLTLDAIVGQTNKLFLATKSDKFKEGLRRLTGKCKWRAEKVVELLGARDGDELLEELQAVRDILRPFRVAVRRLDKDDATLPLKVMSFNWLEHQVGRALETIEFIKPADKRKIAKSLRKDKLSFVGDAEIAAWALTPRALLHDLPRLKTNEARAYDDILRSTKSVLALLVRRFGTEPDSGRALETPLSADDADVKRHVSALMVELKDIVFKEEPWGLEHECWTSKHLDNPSKWWCHDAPASTLAYYAVRLVSMGASTGDVERSHFARKHTENALRANMRTETTTKLVQAEAFLASRLARAADAGKSGPPAKLDPIDTFFFDNGVALDKLLTSPLSRAAVAANAVDVEVESVGGEEDCEMVGDADETASLSTVGSDDADAFKDELDVDASESGGTAEKSEDAGVAAVVAVTATSATAATADTTSNERRPRRTTAGQLPKSLLDQFVTE